MLYGYVTTKGWVALDQLEINYFRISDVKHYNNFAASNSETLYTFITEILNFDI